MDPTAVPLPPSDDTRYYTSSVKNSSPFRGGEEDEEEEEDGYESQQPTIRPTAIHRRGALTDVFDTDTPVVSAAFNPFRTPHVLVDDDECQNTPRPSRRGGKYHPETRHHETRSTTRHSVASCSEAELGDRSDTEEMDTDEPGDGYEDDGGREDMDRKIAINLDSSVAQQLGTHPTVRPRSRRSSPGRTPARKARAFAPSLASIKTPRALSHSSVPTSLFADTQNTPFLSATSPQKLNALQPLANTTPRSLSYHDMLQAKEDEIRQLKEILAVTDGHQQQQQFRDFIDFSPEKRMGEMPASAELTVKKRRSPHKHAQPDTSPAALVGAPLKPTGVFEGIAKPITAEERKRARRRRVTQEFREFSAIDLNSLKESIFFPQPAVIEESEEVAEAQCCEEEGGEEGGDGVGGGAGGGGGEQLVGEETNIGPVEDASEQPIEDDEEEVRIGTEAEEGAGDSVGKELEEEEEEEEEETGDGTRSLIVPPLNRTRQYRSSSAPPVPRAPEDMAANTFNKFSAPTTTPMDVDAAHDLEVARLNQTIAELWDKLETADVQIERLKTEMVGERKLRINAERACEFLEMERKFGVCCPYNPGSQPAKEKLGPAAVQLPNSSPPPPPPPRRAPAMEENRRPVRPKSRLGGPATSNRLGERPATRLGGERPTERPPTRLGGHGARNPPPAPAPAPATKKRTREELPVPPGKRAAAARPEKRVLSGSAAANIMLGSSTSNTASSLAKKPEKAKAAGRGIRSVAGAAPVTRAGVLSRGARR